MESCEEKQCLAILKDVPVGIVRASLEARVLWANPFYCRLLGYELNEIVSMSLKNQTHSEDWHMQEAPHAKLLRGEIDHYSLDKRMRRKDGTYVWINLILTAIRTESGQMECLVGCVKDITHRKFLEEERMAYKKALETSLAELDSQRKLLTTLMDNLPIAVYAKDLSDKFRFNFWNKSAEKVFGMPKDQILGRNVYELVSEEEANRYQANDEKIVAGGELVEATSEVMKTLNRGTLVLHTKRIPVGGGEGKPATHLLCLAEDVTEARQLEKQAESTRMQAVAMAKMAALGEMASGIGHEVNNPLAAIQARVEDLQDLIRKDGIDRESLISQLKLVETTCGRIEKIIKGLRLFSRESGGLPFTLASLQEIISDTLAFCAERFRENNIELHVQNPSSEVTLECRPMEISQILLNLLNNAFDAVEALPDKWIRIEVTEDLGDVEIRVTDSGKGIPAEQRDRVMQPFFSTKKPDRGTGLGLSISKGIAERHNGSLTIDSSWENTSFKVRLPKTQPPGGAAPDGIQTFMGKGAARVYEETKR